MGSYLFFIMIMGISKLQGDIFGSFQKTWAWEQKNHVQFITHSHLTMQTHSSCLGNVKDERSMGSLVDTNTLFLLKLFGCVPFYLHKFYFHLFVKCIQTTLESINHQISSNISKTILVIFALFFSSMTNLCIWCFPTPMFSMYKIVQIT